MVKAKQRAAGYVRVSQVGARNGDSFLSPELQREKIEAWAEYRGVQVVAWFTDLDRSGRTGAHRPEFERMMATAAAGEFDVICVYRLTRFARSVADAARRYGELEQHGVDLVSVTEEIDTTTAGGKLMRNVLSSLAEFESDRIGEEWRNVHAARRRRGLAHVTVPMLGYRVANGTIEGVVSEEAEAVRRIFQLRLHGASLTAISDTLRREGHRPKKAERFASPTIRKILRNPVYAGLVALNGDLLEGAHEAIVSRDEWEAAQALNGRTNRLAKHRTGLLSGLMVCAGCGYRMWNGRGARPNVRVYRCPSRWASRDCPQRGTINAAGAEEHVQAQLLLLLESSRDRMPRGGKVKLGRGQASRLAKAKRLRARADELTGALDRLAERHFVKGTVEADEYERQFQRFATERADAQQEAGELEAVAKAAPPPVDVDVIDHWPNYDQETRQRVLRLAVERVVVGPPTGPRGSTRSDPADRLTISWR